MDKIYLIPLIFVFIFSFSLACDCEPAQFTPGQPTNFTWVVLDSSSSNVSYATHPPTNCTLLWENMSKIGELDYNGSGIFYYTLNLTNESDYYNLIVNCTDGNYTSSVMCTTEIMTSSYSLPISLIIIAFGFILIGYILIKGQTWVSLLGYLYIGIGLLLILLSNSYLVMNFNDIINENLINVISVVIYVYMALVVFEIIKNAIELIREMIK